VPDERGNVRLLGVAAQVLKRVLKEGSVGRVLVSVSQKDKGGWRRVFED